MSGKTLKEKARSLPIVLRIKETFGKRWKTSHVQTYMQKFMEAKHRPRRQTNGRGGG